MKVIENKIIPPKGFKAINLLGILFKRSDTSEVTDVDINHESIHTAQMKELLYIPFYIIYMLEWIVRLFQHKFDAKAAYYAISFEVEALKYESNPYYLYKRKHYAQWRS